MSSPAHIVICDDEANIRELISLFLERYHYKISQVGTGQELLDFLSNQSADLILLDLMLPDMYGMDVCKEIRQSSAVPIIMLTAVQGEMNTVLGFESGADDYIEKPFSNHVLLSRIQAILKRTQNQGELQNLPSNAPYKSAQLGQWTYNPEDACLKHSSGKHIFLTRNENIVLNLFLVNEQDVLSREKIAHALHIDADDIESRAIDVQISRLRNKLKDKSQQNLIRSIRNKGYLLTIPTKITP